ncbi:c-type cytochrome [Inquilinus sp. Marseille-Q2685]|uniref:c-type cytochrome n=1 Tax=Inquilinus sp. Marseille-Q2685 TaxID=2866581 RepID=UPI001CE45A3E|nr:c-type cytochrome [Inquilinus sp. Marseille-Q2685]
MPVPAAARRRAMAFGALIAVAGAVALGAVLVLSGIYNVGASAGHLPLTDRLLKLVLWRSVDTHSAGIEAPDLADPGLVRLGARHFAAGCEPCHAGPGIRQSPVAAAMVPAPPALDDSGAAWEARELFWIVRHGFKFTGMPQWPGDGRDDEVWPVVAFLRRLPGMSPGDYAALTGRETAGSGTAGCALCHGDAGRVPVADPAPALQGQNEAYLRRALEEYAVGARQSGMMEAIAAGLPPGERDRLARDFAAMPPPAGGDTARDPEAVERGAAIALHGAARQAVPPCLACHSGQRSSQFPRLDGLSAGYVAGQLRLFRDGVRGGTPYGAIMAPIAGRLTDRQIEDAAAYFASRDRPGMAAGTGEAAR